MTEPDPSALAAEDVAGPDGDDPGDLDEISGAEDPDPAYLAIEDWVTGYFLPMFRRTLGGEFRWCHHWWQHGEAISRLTALWHSWEVLRLQPGTGIATWYRDYLDQQLPILMGARGPFCQCSETSHREPRQADAAPVPGDWWDLDPDDPDSTPLPGPPALQPATGVTDAAPDSYRAGVDPAHIWTIATAAVPAMKHDGAMMLVNGQHPARLALPNRIAALDAEAALQLVGYQVDRARGGVRGRDLIITGWSDEGLQQRLTAMRDVLHKLATVPNVTAFLALELGRLPTAMLPSQIDQRLVVERAAQRLRTWISRTSGIHAPRDPRALPADPRSASRLAATSRAEKVIDYLAEQHRQLAELAVGFYPQLRQRLDHATAREVAIHYANRTYLSHREAEAPAPVRSDEPVSQPPSSAESPDHSPGPTPRSRLTSEFPVFGKPISPAALPPSNPQTASPRGRTFPFGRAGRRLR